MQNSISLVWPYTHDPLRPEGDAWVTRDGKTRYPVVDGIPNCVYPPRLGTDVKERTLRSLIRLQDGRYLVCRESLPLPWPGRMRSVRRVDLVPAAKAA